MRESYFRVSVSSTHAAQTRSWQTSYEAGLLAGVCRGKGVILKNEDAIDFVVRSNQDGLTSKRCGQNQRSSEISSYLIGCCADFGLLAGGARKSTREINAYHIDRSTTLFLAYDLHLSAGKSDNAMIANLDWRLFGLETGDVIAQLRQLMTDDHFVIQSAGGLVNIAWKYNDMESVINVIS